MLLKSGESSRSLSARTTSCAAARFSSRYSWRPESDTRCDAIQPRVLRVDRDEHLHDVIFGQLVEDDGRHRERIRRRTCRARRAAPAAGAARRWRAGCPRARAPSACPWDALGHRLEPQALVARDDDGAGDRRQIARLPALLVVLHELVDLAADDLPLVRLLVRADAPLEQVPVDLRRAAPRRPPRTGWCAWSP